MSPTRGQECGRADSTTFLLWGGMCMGVMRSLPAPPPSLATSSSWENCPQSHELGKLFRPLTSCSTGESRPCTSPGQHSRSDHGVRGTGEPAPRARVWCGELILLPPLIWHEVSWVQPHLPPAVVLRLPWSHEGGGTSPAPSLTVALWSTSPGAGLDGEGLSERGLGAESGRAGPAPQRLHHVGE